MKPPLFTILSPTLNCACYLPRNLASVRAQQLAPGQIEHWIIDGGSTDGTVEYLKQQPDIKFTSEKDRGLSDAVNKGVQRATGEWIVWLNADDELAPGALRQFLEALPHYPETWVFVGALKFFNYDGREERRVEGWDYNLKELLGRRTGINQSATFVHRRVFQEAGLLDLTYRYAMDYEWVIRVAQKFRCQPLPILLTHYHRRPGSITDQGLARQFQEFLRARRQYGCSYFAPGEWRIRLFLATQPLRRIAALRQCVRQIKALFGHEPTHPFSQT